MIHNRIGFLVATLALTGFGCSSDSADGAADVRTADLALATEVPAPYGSARWFEIEDIDVLPADTPASQAVFYAEEGDGPHVDPTDDDIGVDDLINKKRYALVYPDGFGEGLPSTHESPDLGPARDSGDETVDLVQKGWSDDNANTVGDDARTDHSGSSNATYRRFGYVSTGCTATMLAVSANGNTGYALTAAHCVYSNTGTAIAATFDPAEGSIYNAGLWTTTAITRDNNWITNACYAGSTQTDSCRQYDIALLTMNRNAGTTYLGGLGYATFSDATIASTSSKWHGGYPACGIPGAPSGCSAGPVQKLWLDINLHSVTNFRQTDRLFDHSSDLNGGHSGGPMYLNSGGILYVYGVQSGEYCVGTCTANAHQTNVNLAVRISSSWFTTMQNTLP